MALDVEDREARGSLDHLVGGVVGGKYRVERLIGRGGMGAVFQATNLAIGKRVALKFLDRDATLDRDAFERFQREALAASVVESAHIVHLFDSGTSEDGRPFLVMELLSGEDLRSRLRREQKLPAATAVALAKQVLRALVRAHAAGIVHRDLKPDNLFLCERDDGALFVKVVDFGISKLVATGTLDTLTRRGTVLGTAYYMSPEQAQAFADVDGRTDLFSVGAILFECLCGRPPHVGPTYEAVLIAICTRDAEDVRELVPDVPEPVALAVGRALSRDRELRFQSADEFLAALTTCYPNTHEAAEPSALARSTSEVVLHSEPPELGSTSHTRRERQRARSWIGAGAALLLGFASTALWMGAQRPAASASAGEPAEAAAAAAAPASPGSLAAPAARPRELATPTPPQLASPAPSPSATAVLPASSSADHSAPRRARVQPTARKKSDVTPEKSERPRSAVAPGLQLSTREP